MQFTEATKRKRFPVQQLSTGTFPLLQVAVSLDPVLTIRTNVVYKELCPRRSEKRKLNFAAYVEDIDASALE